MINVNFVQIGDILVGFDVKGHSENGVKGTDIVCASVSSACYMAANTITEILGVDSNIKLEDGYMQLTVPSLSDAGKAQDILKGLKLHLTEIAKEYPKYVTII